MAFWNRHFCKSIATIKNSPQVFGHYLNSKDSFWDQWPLVIVFRFLVPRQARRPPHRSSNPRPTAQRRRFDGEKWFAIFSLDSIDPRLLYTVSNVVKINRLYIVHVYFFFFQNALNGGNNFVCRWDECRHLFRIGLRPRGGKWVGGWVRPCFSCTLFSDFLVPPTFSEPGAPDLWRSFSSPLGGRGQSICHILSGPLHAFLF